MIALCNTIYSRLNDILFTAYAVICNLILFVYVSDFSPLPVWRVRRCAPYAPTSPLIALVTHEKSASGILYPLRLFVVLNRRFLLLKRFACCVVREYYVNATPKNACDLLQFTKRKRATAQAVVERLATLPEMLPYLFLC